MLDLLKSQWSKTILFKIVPVPYSPYRRLVGRLIYLTVTRPYLAYSVQVLSQVLVTPKQDHLFADSKVVRYLKTSPGQGLLMPSKSDCFSCFLYL